MSIIVPSTIEQKRNRFWIETGKNIHSLTVRNELRPHTRYNG